MRMISVLLCLLLTSTIPVFGQGSFAKAKSRYDECMGREPVVMKYRGWKALVESGRDEALDILISDYARAPDPEEQVQAYLASAVTENFREERYLPLYESWGDRFGGPRHAWLNYLLLEIKAVFIGEEPVREVFEKAKDPFTAAAALHALIDGRPRIVEELTPELLRKPPRNELERALLLEALIKGFHIRRSKVGDPDYDAALKVLIKQLDEKRVPHRTKLVLSRYLGEIFNSGRRSVNADPWLLQLKSGRNITKTRDEYAPTFFDIRASGDRIAYVIDMSDSMLTPIPRSYTDEKRATGPRRPEQERDRHDPFAGDYRINWHEVENRFDLAREHIKKSLYSLPADKFFTVVGFGDEAKLFSSTPGMIPAKKRNIQRAVRELDGIRPGPREADRPHGTLWGKTNLHGGIRRAFQVKGRGMVPAYEGVSPKTFFDGADTIFVLSDGDPTWDDWHLEATNYGEDRAGDPESRTPQEQLERMNYSGPYRDWDRIIEEVERLNLFRFAEIHCIGIGEAQFSRLERLAKIGLGQSKQYKVQ